MRLSGSIWEEPARIRSQAVRRVSEHLTQVAGTERLGNPDDPLDDLVYIILSNKTAPATARRIYGDLKKRFARWDTVLQADLQVLENHLAPAGLGRVKGRQIRNLLLAIRRRFGACSLAELGSWPTDVAEAYLTSLPGVSGKVAKCVLLFTLDREVLPVDAHVHRVARRLGWTSRNRADQCHEELEALVPPKYRRSFHVGAIIHGRALCRPVSPRCDPCSLQKYCTYAASQN